LDKSGGANLPEKTILKILEPVANVLEHMHKKNVAHRDIKL
jgi:serine/threonine protein kinase